jgi:hypothetical protein
MQAVGQRKYTPNTLEETIPLFAKLPLEACYENLSH